MGKYIDVGWAEGGGEGDTPNGDKIATVSCQAGDGSITHNVLPPH